jgi:hypothetical protein
LIFKSMGKQAPRNALSFWTNDLKSAQDLSKLTQQFKKGQYPIETVPQSGTHVSDQAAERFSERLAEFSVRSRTVDDLISLALFEDWETELLTESPEGFIDGPSSVPGDSTEGFIDGPSSAPGGSTDGFIDGPS